MTTLPGLVGTEALARLLGQPRKRVYRWHEEQGLPAYQVGRSLLFDPEAVLAWLDRQRVGDWSSSSNGNGAASAQPADEGLVME